VKVILTRGLIASGKTTWSKQFVKENSDYIRLSRDDFRHMLDGYSYLPQTEKLITQMMESCIDNAIGQNLNIIIDEQHLNEKFLKEKIDKFKKINCEIEIKEFPVTLGEALTRDSKRSFPIGESVIKNTWKKYEIQLKQILERAKPKYEFKKELDYCWIIDIDGTLADSTHRKIFDFKECINDKVIIPVDLLLAYARHAEGGPEYIILLSGREEVCRKETEAWLTKNNISYDYLYMRKEGDYRADTIIKKELFDRYIKDKYNVELVIDDRPVVLKMWQDMGIFTLNVNQDVYAKNNF